MFDLYMTYHGSKLDINDVEYLLMHRLHRSFSVETLLGWIHGTGLPEGIIEEVLSGLLPEGRPQWAAFHEDLRRGLMIFPPEGVQGKGRARLTPAQTTPLLTAFWRQGLARYGEALALVLPPETSLSGEALALLGLLLWEYLECGYFCSGRVDAVYATLRLFWTTWEPTRAALTELVGASLVRNSPPHSYELFPTTRARLLAHFSLPDKIWGRHASTSSRKMIKQEVAAVQGAGVPKAEE